MRVLEVFLLAVLGCSLAGGRLVSKCELRDQLMTAFGKLMVKAEKGKSVESLVAKIVCHVELTSEFNTSAVDQLTPGMDDHHSRERREAGYRGSFGRDEREDDSGEQEREDKRHPSKTRPTQTTHSKPSAHHTTPTNPTPSTLPTTPIVTPLSTNLATNLNQNGEPSTTIQPRKRRDVSHPPSDTHPTLPSRPMPSNHTKPTARPTPPTIPKTSKRPTPPTRPPHLGEQTHVRERRDVSHPPSDTHPTLPSHPMPSNHTKSTARPTPPTIPKTSKRPTPPTRPPHLGEQTHVRERRDVRHPPSNTRPTPPTHPTPFNHHQQLDKKVWTLYGLFQLSTQLVCNDTTLSPNICGMDCNNLLDDNIGDDISCLMTILNQLIANGFGAPHWKELSKMIRLIFQQECSDQVASEYFAECA